MVWEQTIFYARDKSGKGTVLIGNSKKSFFKQVTFKLRNEGVGVRFVLCMHGGGKGMFQAKKNIWETFEGAKKQAPYRNQKKQRVSPSEIANTKPEQVGRAVVIIKQVLAGHIHGVGFYKKKQKVIGEI